MSSFKVFVFALQAHGHINPLSVVVESLVREHKCRCIWYALDEYKSTIEKTGSECRQIQIDPECLNYTFIQNKRSSDITILMNECISLIDKNTLNIIKEINTEKPDLIIIDVMAYHAKFAISIYEKYFQAKKKLKIDKETIELDFALPKIVYFETTFAKEKNVFPNKMEEELLHFMSRYEKLRGYLQLLYHSFRIRLRAWKYGIEYIAPMKEIQENNIQCLKLVSIFPEFQPRYHLFNENTKFIGCCINDQLRFSNQMDSRISKILVKYKPDNPLNPEGIKNRKNKLVYIALGTIFNQHVLLYNKIVKAIKLLQLENGIIYEDYDFVISSGETFDKIEKSDLPDNIHIFKSTPQLEMLKRASLFVSHCGMNSMNEAIFYAVPTVCMPLAVDQTLVAHRASVDLGIGIFIDFETLKPEQLKDVMLKILNDDRFFQRVFKWSLESRKYDGRSNGSNEIMNILCSNKKN